jgi:hypothetical protein
MFRDNPAYNRAQTKVHDFAKKRENEKAKFADRKPKPKRWSHQSDLDALIGKTIYIRFIDGEAYTGKLLGADQFTLKMRIPNADFPVVIYKSSLTDFRQVSE